MATDISSSPTNMASIALLKRPQPIDPTIPIISQIQIINLPGVATLNSTANGQGGASVSPFEILHSVVHLALGPYFDAYTKTQQTTNGVRGRSDVEAKTGIPVTKKR